MIGVAIIGGGVAGSYCAYRLALREKAQRRSPPARGVHLFEMSSRIGGRLLSKNASGIDIPMEFGGMYYGDRQENVAGLLQRLKLETEQLESHGRHHYLRSHLLEADDYTIPRKAPYFVETSEAGKHPIELLIDTLLTEFPDLKELWPLAQGIAPRKTAEYLRALSWRGRPLHDWGFWNLLSEVVSNEAYEMMLAVSPSVSTMRNGNAYDTIWVILNELLFFQQKLRRVKDGFQALPKRLMDEAELAGAVVHLRCELREVERIEGGVRLRFAEGADPVEAAQLILALPRRSLERIKFDECVFSKTVLADMASVIQVPACKLFLAFDSPWWLEATCKTPDLASSAQLTISSTDMPMRQCFYFGAPNAGEPALMLATFADDAAATFWKGLRSPNHCEEHRSQLLEGGDHVFCAPPAMIQSSHRQLTLMHPGFEVSKPIDAAYFDWSDEPYGAAWHGWKAYIKSWEAAKRMRRPNPDAPVYICGEAYASLQGWVEGAINVAEAMLEDNFGLDRPGWVISPDYEFQIE